MSTTTSQDTSLLGRHIHSVITGAAAGLSGLAATAASGSNLNWGSLAASGLAALVVGIGTQIYMRVTVNVPRDKLRQSIRATVADGDLSRRADTQRTMAPVARDFNALMASFQGIVGRVVFNSEQVGNAAKKLIEEARSTVEGSERQHAAAASAAETAQSMATGISGLAQTTEDTTRIAEAARQQSEHGAQIMRQASDEIERLARSVENSATVVSALGERSEAVSAIVNTIHEIADQTNLLALNAAIEAARAGEQGRGFAVVADEVRKLAERTTTATTEIGGLIHAIQTEIHQAIATIHEGSSLAREGAGLTTQAAEALTRINEGAEETLDKIRVIAVTMQQQNAQAHHIADQAGDIIHLATRNAEGARNTLAEATQLDYLATNLDEIGTVFKLGASGEASRRIHGAMPNNAMQLAQEITRAIEAAVSRKEISLDDLFDDKYVPIPNTKPQKFSTKFDVLLDRILPSIQEPYLDRNPEVAYAIAIDRNAYVPTHNKRFCQPLTGDEAKDMVGNRTKRIFSDAVGKRCGSHQQPFLIQTYRRDTGEIMHDISSPVYIQGRHWGGVRIGYKTE
ncbi:MAG TPA: methyl-accepting chemotaxis protein [Rhodocyclaceae bacterium]|nr:methyl-accepting chemotaxis protein [Rhodocyclaceae bacterium]